MTVDSVLRRLLAISERFEDWQRPFGGWEQRPSFHPPATAEQLAAVERRAGTIPDDLRAFLSVTSQIVAMDIHNGYWIGGDVNLDPRTDVGWPDRLQTPTGETRIIAVAADGGGNAFLMSPEAGTVWSWDHETGQTEKVAESFTDFLARVADDWEHYAGNDHDWRYLV
jgi:cell wall assembly regulator SMI1